MNKIKVSKINVPSLFINSIPNEDKLKARILRIQSGEEIPITIDYGKNLIDGYIAFIAYQQLGYKQVPFIEDNSEYSNKLKVYKRDKGRCYICNKKLSFKEMTLDHVIPKTKGGISVLSNLKCCCSLCNNLKSNFTLSDALIDVIHGELRERGLLDET